MCLSSARRERRCDRCGSSRLDPFRYCVVCGNRTVPTCFRSELALSRVGGVTDVGRHKRHNQDAIAIGTGPASAIAIVCDGISQSTFGELAALHASETGVEQLLFGLASGKSNDAASNLAAASAATAAARIGRGITTTPPGCTYASIVVDHETITVSSIGDSRVYWISGDHAECLTVDDTKAGYLAASGVPFDDDRYRDPDTNALLRWLGADAPPVDAPATVHRPDREGFVVVCSDGLSGYTDRPRDLLPMPSGPPVAQASALVGRALRQGGRDNVSVAVAPFPQPTRRAS